MRKKNIIIDTIARKGLMVLLCLILKVTSWWERVVKENNNGDKDVIEMTPEEWSQWSVWRKCVRDQNGITYDYLREVK